MHTHVYTYVTHPHTCSTQKELCIQLSQETHNICMDVNIEMARYQIFITKGCHGATYSNYVQMCAEQHNKRIDTITIA